MVGWRDGWRGWEEGIEGYVQNSFVFFFPFLGWFGGWVLIEVLAVTVGKCLGHPEEFWYRSV